MNEPTPTVNGPIVKGSIVLYIGKWYRVKAAFKDTVNLGSVFGSKTTIKSVPRNQVIEDEADWYAKWQNSETYKCM
jgi:hypothetical protein